MSLLRTKGLQIGQDGTATNNFTLYQPGVPDGTLRIGNGNNGSVTDAITLNSVGRVGIGTSSPSSNLHVQTTGADAGITIEETSNTAYSQYLRLKDSTSSWYVVNRHASSGSGNTGFGIGTTNSGDYLQIDTSGRVTTPSQPAFLAYYSAAGDITVNVGTDYVFDATKYNIGSHYNTANGRFTAPVAGYYTFEMHVYFTNSGGNTQQMGAAYRVNGGAYSGSDAIGHTDRRPNDCGGTITGESSITVYLNASDYVTMFARTNNNRFYKGHTSFCGRLIG